MKEKIKLAVCITFSGLFGFLIGQFQLSQPTTETVRVQSITPEISLVQLQKIVDDELFVKISGPARLLWAKENLVENDGVFQIPLGQIPNENDLKLESFPFLGNTKTKKFYPATSYPARGTEVRYRRFFKTKEAAIDAGFVASKLVK